MYTLQPPGTNGWDAITIDPDDVRHVDAPRSGRTVSGYGSRIPTDTMIRYGNVWRRVYVAIYGNAGSAYVMIQGQKAYVESY